MKLTTRQLRKMIKEELIREGALDRLKGSLGMSPKLVRGSKEEVIKQVENIRALSTELVAAIEELMATTENTTDLMHDLDADPVWEKRAIASLVAMGNTARKVKKLIHPGESAGDIGLEMELPGFQHSQ